jgi:beta-galactosidase beta subunit
MGHDLVILPQSKLADCFPESAREAALAFADEARKGQKTPGNWEDFGSGIRAVYLVSGAASADVLEFHRINTDIHLTVNGRDSMHVGSADAETVQPYDQDKDFGLVKAVSPKVFSIGQGHFLLIKPCVPHINLLDAGSGKIVFKIAENG